MKNNRKDEVIRIRTSKTEKEALMQCAASTNQKLSEYVRHKISSEDSISRKEIPNLIQTWTMLNTLCREIEKSGDKHLIDTMNRILRQRRK